MPKYVTFKVHPRKLQTFTDGDPSTIRTYEPLPHEVTGWDVLERTHHIRWYMRSRIHDTQCEVLSLASTLYRLRHILVDVNPTVESDTLAEVFTVSAGRNTLLDGYEWPTTEWKEQQA